MGEEEVGYVEAGLGDGVVEGGAGGVGVEGVDVCCCSVAEEGLDGFEVASFDGESEGVGGFWVEEVGGIGGVVEEEVDDGVLAPVAGVVEGSPFVVVWGV